MAERQFFSFISWWIHSGDDVFSRSAVCTAGHHKAQWTATHGTGLSSWSDADAGSFELSPKLIDHLNGWTFCARSNQVNRDDYSECLMGILCSRTSQDIVMRAQLYNLIRGASNILMMNPCINVEFMNSIYLEKSRRTFGPLDQKNTKQFIPIFWRAYYPCPEFKASQVSQHSWGSPQIQKLKISQLWSWGMVYGCPRQVVICD